MIAMLGKLRHTRKGHLLICWAVAFIGIVLVITVDNTRAGTLVFVSVTALESGLFCLIYGLRATWREVPAARAVFWAVLAYFGVTAHLVTLYAWSTRFWWTDDLRELLFLGLVVAGLNLVLTLGRVM
jgi:hypothetical protein